MAEPLPNEPALIAELEKHARVEPHPEALDIWLGEPKAVRQIVTVIASAGAALLGFMVTVFSSAGIEGAWSLVAMAAAMFVVLTGAVLAWARRRSVAPTLRLTGATLETLGRSLPLENIQKVVVSSGGAIQHLEIDLDAERLRVPLSRAEAGAPLVGLLRQAIDRRATALVAEGHDVSEPARIPPEVRHLRQR